MKKILFLVALIISTQTYSKNNDYYCFSNKSTVLLISSSYPNIRGLKYYPYLKNIKISKPVEVKEIDMGDNAKPEVYRVMNEIVNGKVTGQYEFMSQGYVLYDVSYTNLKSKKKTIFLKDNLVIENINCI